MRQGLFGAGLACILLLPVAASAQDRTSDVQGFGGLTVGTTSFGTATSSTFGGRADIGLGGNLQVVMEGGRMADVKSPLFDLLDFADVGVQLSAWYGEGGVRFIASPHSGVRPYGEATAGFAKLNPHVTGLDGIALGIAKTALTALDTTKPMLGVGGGVVFQGGPLSLDVGYRYKRIYTGNSIATVLNAGSDIHVNQVRVGVGVRF